MSHVDKLIALAERLASETSDFHVKKGPGKGDLATNAYLKALQELARQELGAACRIEEDVCDSTNLRFDFYFPDEQTAVEIALGLGNPQSEFERDIFKALLANDSGKPVKRLVLVGRPNSRKRHTRDDSAAIIKFVKRHHGIEVEVRELRRG